MACGASLNRILHSLAQLHMHVCIVAIQNDDDDNEDKAFVVQHQHTSGVFAVVPTFTERFRVLHLWVKLHNVTSWSSSYFEWKLSLLRQEADVSPAQTENKS